MEKKIKQIFEFKDIVGKTVSNVYTADYYLLISFTDNSFIATDEYYLEYLAEIDKTDYELVELGLITLEEWEVAVDEYDKAWKLKEELAKKETEDRELALYETLKLKYGKS